MPLHPLLFAVVIAWCVPVLALAAPSYSTTRLELALSVAGTRIEVDGKVVADSAGQVLTLEVNRVRTSSRRARRASKPWRSRWR